MEQTPNPNVQGSAAPEQKTSWAALAGLVVVVFALAAGAYYLQEILPEPAVTDAQMVQNIETQSDSTEPEAIEADLEAQSPDEFDQEFDEAFAELDASLE